MGADTATEVAATAPAVSASPRTATHCPTTIALASAATVVVYAVDASTVAPRVLCRL